MVEKRGRQLPMEPGGQFQTKTASLSDPGTGLVLVKQGLYGSLTKILTMSPLISVDEEERVTGEHEACSVRTLRDMDALAVSGYQETADKP